MYRVGRHLLDGLYPSCDLDRIRFAFGSSERRFLVSLCDVHFATTTTTTTFFLLIPLGVFLLLTWEFASLDGYTACGEVRCEELRLCGLA